MSDQMKVNPLHEAISMNELIAKVGRGEMTMEEAADTIEGMEGTIHEKLDRYISVIEFMEDNQTSCNKRASEYSERGKMWGNQINQVRGFIYQIVKAATKGGKDTSIRTAYNTFTIKKKADQLILPDDLSTLPMELYDLNTVYKPKTADIKKALKSGETIDGCYFQDGGETLQITR